MIMATFLLCSNEGSAARYVEEMTGSRHDGNLPPLKAPITDFHIHEGIEGCRGDGGG
jgi:hypothetical protein